MKRITRTLFPAVIAGLVLVTAACGDSVQEQASDQAIEVIKSGLEAEGVELTADAEACIRGVIESQSEETLLSLEDSNIDLTDPATAEAMAAIQTGVQDCVVASLVTP